MLEYARANLIEEKLGLAPEIGERIAAVIRLRRHRVLPSAVTHSEGKGSRLSLARMVSAGLVRMKGFEDRLCSRM